MMLRRVAEESGPLERPGEALRPHRLAGGDVELDEGLEDVAAALVEAADVVIGPQRSSGRRPLTVEVRTPVNEL